MADLRYLTPNRVGTLRVSWNRSDQRNTLVVGLPLVIIAAGFNRVLAALVFAGVVMYCLAKGRTPVLHAAEAEGAVAKAGTEGERIALETLSSLPNTYTVFNNVYLESRKSSTGFREGDLVVVGPTGVFVVEVKHNRGEITCDAESARWPVQSVGRGGKVYDREMKNPVGQVSSYAFLLAQHLKTKGAPLWVQGVVVFTHPETKLFCLHASVPILQPDDLTDYLTFFPILSSRDVGRAKRELIEMVENPFVKT